MSEGCPILRLRLFSHVTWLGTGQFQWSIGTNGTIGTNGKAPYSNGSIGKYASHWGDLDYILMWSSWVQDNSNGPLVPKDAKSHRKTTGKARNSVVLERKGTLHGVVLTHLLQTSTLLLPLKLRTNTNLWNGNLKSAMIKKLPKKWKIIQADFLRI